MSARLLQPTANLSRRGRSSALDVLWSDGRTRWDGWLPLSLAGTLVVTAIEAFLIERRYAVFAGGFLAETPLDDTSSRVAFLLWSALADFAIVGLLAGLALRVCLRTRLSPAARRFLVFAMSVTPLLAYDVLSYQLLNYLGGSFDLLLMFDLVGGRVSEFAAVGAGRLLPPLAMLGAAAAAIALVTWTLQRQSRPDSRLMQRVVAPPVSLLVLIVLAAMATLTAVRASSLEMNNSLRRKSSAQGMAHIVTRATDVDRDGYGIGMRPADSAPFDGAVHPYATDVAGNGVDENGVGGDLPLRAAAAPPERAVPWLSTPDVVFVLLESVRGDVIGATLNGQAVTPTLDALQARGGAARRAYSHNGFTYQSRYHLLTGRMLPGGDRSSLIDDFKANRYQVGYFSGQDDSFGGPELAVGYERADVFFDARQAVERRYTQFTTPGSLAVPAAVVNEHALEFIKAADPQRPLFLYVNYHDTHFPYHHDGMAPLLNATPLSASAIAPEKAVQLRATYLNTLANVDRSLGALLLALQEKRQRSPAVIVTSDHGESLFDEGFLGHGYALNEAQTRVPLIVAGLPLALSEPSGHTDIRRAVHRALVNTPASDRPQFVDDASHVTFQYLGSDVLQPRQIAFTALGGRTLYDFRTEQVRGEDGRWQSAAEAGARETGDWLPLLHFWERLGEGRSQ